MGGETSRQVIPGRRFRRPESEARARTLGLRSSKRSSSVCRIAEAHSKITFEGRVAVVTGAGRGMGRAYALLIAQRGGAVVVNDLGVDVWGGGTGSAVADEVVAEIEAAGGRAVASAADSGTPEGGAAVVDTALEAFGRVDVLVHNAGIKQDSAFADTDLAELRRIFEVNALSAWYVGQPAWREMLRGGYGRIVLTSSASVFGLGAVGGYAATKAGLIGLTRSLDQEAQRSAADLKVNALLPMAATRMSSEGQRELWKGLNDASEVAPVVGYLASEACGLSGRAIVTGGTHVAEVRLSQSPGWAHGATGLTPEDVAGHLSEITDFSAPVYPTSTVGYMEDTYHRVTGGHLSMVVTVGGDAL